MRKFIIKLINGDNIKITEEEYKNLTKQTANSSENILLYIPSAHESINSCSISRIVSEEKYNLELREKRTESERGVLHDGTPVVRKFGMYYLASNPEVVIDTTHYPEASKDCVPTVEEYEQHYAQLPREKRLEAILGTIDDTKRLGEGFKQIEK